MRNVIVRTPSPDPPTFFRRGGGVNFNYLPQREKSEKLKKKGASMVQGQVFLKSEGTDIFPV